MAIPHAGSPHPLTNPSLSLSGRLVLFGRGRGRGRGHGGRRGRGHCSAAVAIGIGTASGQVFAAKRKSDGTIVARTRFNASDCYSEYNLDAAGLTLDRNSFVRDVSCRDRRARIVKFAKELVCNGHGFIRKLEKLRQRIPFSPRTLLIPSLLII